MGSKRIVVRWTNEARLFGAQTYLLAIRYGASRASAWQKMNTALTTQFMEAKPRPYHHGQAGSFLQWAEKHERFMDIPKPEAAPAPAPEPTPEPPPPQSPMDVLAGAIRDGLSMFARELGTTIGRTISEEIGERLFDMKRGFTPRGAIEAEAKQESTAPSAESFGNLDERFHKPKICVIGLLPAQQQVLSTRFPHIEFRFLESRHTSTQIETVAKNCNATYSMTKFIGHHNEAKVKALPSHYRCPGAVSDLSRLIENRFPTNPGNGRNAMAQH